jgi:hypothetical protein
LDERATTASGIVFGKDLALRIVCQSLSVVEVCRQSGQDLRRERCPTGKWLQLRKVRRSILLERVLAMLQQSLGPLAAAPRGIPLQPMLAYRDVSAFAEMVALYEEFLDDLRNNPLARRMYTRTNEMRFD